MLKYYIIFVVFLINVYDTVSYDVIECSSNNNTLTSLKTNDFVYFTSPAFPQTISNLTYSSPCYGNFERDNSSLLLWIAIINGASKYIMANDSDMSAAGEFDSDNEIIVHQFTKKQMRFEITENRSKMLWTAFQAIIGSWDGKNIKCAMSETTYNLTNDFQTIIPVVENLFYGYDIGPVNCKWSFIISNNQMLKVVVRKFLLSESFNLTLTIDGNLLANLTEYVNFTKVYYFKGNVFDFEYNSPDGLFTLNKLVILVSAVQFPGSYSNQIGCFMEVLNENVTNLSNMNLVNGYLPYQICDLDVLVRPGHISVLSSADFYIEKCCDNLKLYYGSSKILDLLENLPFRMSPTNGNGTVVFLSDGNTQKAGFNLRQEYYECACSEANIVIDCENETTLTPLSGTNYYCEFMDCSYTIISSLCKGTYFDVAFSVNFVNSSDYISLYVNSNSIQHIDESILSYNSNLYSSNVNITVEFHSDADSENITNNFWSAMITPKNGPTFTNIQLNSMTSYYFLWIDDLKPNDAYTICTEAETTLQLFIATPYDSFEIPYFIIYDSKDLDQQGIGLDTLLTETPQDLTKVISESGCFTIYRTNKLTNLGGTAISMFFDMQEIHSNNCYGEDNVFVITHYDKPAVSHSLSSSSESSCELILLSQYDYAPLIVLLEMETTLFQNYTLLNIVNNETFIEFNSSNFSKWMIYGINTNALSIMIPPSSTLVLTPQLNKPQPIRLDTTIQKGYLASLTYHGNFDDSKTRSNLVAIDEYQLSCDNIMTLTVNAIVQDSNLLFLQDLSTNDTTPLEKGISITRKGTKFGIEQYQSGPVKFLIEYTMSQKEHPTIQPIKEGTTTEVEEIQEITTTSKQSSTVTSNTGSINIFMLTLMFVSVAFLF